MPKLVTCVSECGRQLLRALSFPVSFPVSHHQGKHRDVWCSKCFKLCPRHCSIFMSEVLTTRCQYRVFEGTRGGVDTVTLNECSSSGQLQQACSLQEYEKVHRLNLEWKWDHGNRTCSFDVSASPTQLVDALQVTNPAKLAQLPLLAPDIGRLGKKRLAHTRLVAHLAVALVLTKQDQIDLNFGLPEHQATPRFASQSTKLVNMQLRKQLDAWLAALVAAAGNSHATKIVCSSYVLQAAARHEYSRVLGHKRLTFQRAPFQQAPRVVLRVNTDTCDLTDGLVWRALRNIPCLELQFEVDRARQRAMLHNLPAGSIHCLGVSGCDVQAPGMLGTLCGTLRRIRELESFQLGAAAQVFSDVEERPLQGRQLECLSRSLLRRFRIVSVDFHNKSAQQEVCVLAAAVQT